jgi:hypothetical protein
MRCLFCDAEMVLVKVVQDGTLMVPGFEHHTFMCSACGDVERRLAFTKLGREDDTKAIPLVPHHPVPQRRANAAAPSFFRRVVAKIRAR